MDMDDRNERDENAAHTIGASVRPMATGTIAAAPEHDDEDLRILAAKWAGGLYLLLALSLLPYGGMNPVALIIDVALSIALLRGQLKWRGLFIFRLVLGSVFGAVQPFVTGAPDAVLSAVFAVMLCGATLLLLVGTPGTVRRRVGISLTLSFTALVALGAILG